MKQKQEVTFSKFTASGSGRYAVFVNGNAVAKGLTAVKARRRANGIKRGIMDFNGRCLTRKERGLKPIKKKKDYAGIA